MRRTAAGCVEYLSHGVMVSAHTPAYCLPRLLLWHSPSTLSCLHIPCSISCSAERSRCAEQRMEADWGATGPHPAAAGWCPHFTERGPGHCSTVCPRDHLLHRMPTPFPCPDAVIENAIWNISTRMELCPLRSRRIPPSWRYGKPGLRHTRHHSQFRAFRVFHNRPEDRKAHSIDALGMSSTTPSGTRGRQ